LKKKRKKTSKNVEVITHMPSPEDHSDHLNQFGCLSHNSKAIIF